MAVVESQVGGSVLAVPPVAAPAVTAAPRSGWLFHPLVDFFCLGGGSMLVLGALMLVPSSMALQADFAFWALIVAHVINHPHFAHSYQIFYSGFRRKAFGDSFEPGLRLRYVFAGIYVPILLGAYLVTTIVMGSVAALAYGANAMFFLVGWHYVKQGYGMAMLDAVLKKRFFKPAEKKVLLWNGYAGWLVSWLYVNQIVAKFDYWGLAYYSFATPAWMMDAAFVAAGVTTLALVAMVLLKAVKEQGRLPWNGLIGYVVSLYGWLILARINPLFTLFVPAFHSLQYLVVVWRYQLNRTRAAPDAGSRPAGVLPSIGLLRNVLFLVLGVLFGYLGFWGLPEWLNGHVAYDRALFGASVFLFVFWIFINIHHYFLDNVMWRRENPETRRHLFGAK
jgi:hypothetical protein